MRRCHPRQLSSRGSGHPALAMDSERERTSGRDPDFSWAEWGRKRKGLVSKDAPGHCSKVERKGRSYIWGQESRSLGGWESVCVSAAPTAWWWVWEAEGCSVMGKQGGGTWAHSAITSQQKNASFPSPLVLYAREGADWGQPAFSPSPTPELLPWKNWGGGEAGLISESSVATIMSCKLATVCLHCGILMVNFCLWKVILISIHG